MDADKQWAFSHHPSSEDWKGPFPTKDAAMLEALAYYGDPDDGFKPCVAECRPVRPEDDIGDMNWTFLVTGEPEVLLESLLND